MNPSNIMRAPFLDGQFGAVTNLSRKDRYAEWGGTVPVNALPEERVEISVWAADAAGMTALRLKHSFFLDRSSHQPGDNLLAATPEEKEP
jgi:hypothetical protein